jgi:hypothetical protein
VSKSPASPPADLSGKLFNAGYHRREWINHPYDLYLDDLRAIVSYCEQYGLDVHLSARRAFLNPGERLAVIYTKTE